MGYAYSRVSQNALTTLINKPSTPSMTKQQPGLPDAMLPGLNTTLTPNFPNSLITGNSSSLPYSLTAVSSCPTAGTDACIQLRADAVGSAVTQLFITANTTEKVGNQFRIGLYPFVRDLKTYFGLTSTINGSPTTPGTINYAAANLASQIDTNADSILGSGGTHFENAFPEMNNLIVSVGDGSASNRTLPYVFLVTDGALTPQVKGLGGGNTNWSGSNHATVLDPVAQCKPLKDRGIIISVLYIPYQPIQNPTTIYGNEDGFANANIPNIQPSLQACASPNFFFTANTPQDITDALNKMFNQAVITAHITN
jgi:hypothetical protein